MIISIASGKGGTGKTTVATSFALSLDNTQLLDCDVEEPNAHIFMNPSIEKTKSVSIAVPVIDKDICLVCGACKQACRYNAIAVLGTSVLVFSELCHGCGACTYICPTDAICEEPKDIGIVEIGMGRGIPFVHGKLNIGAAMAPPVIRAVKQEIDRAKTVIIDAPPGTSCPVISAMKDTDFCVLVTEPTPFGLHDLQLAIDVVKKINIPHGVVINRATLGDSETEKYCAAEHIEVLMRIPFDKKIARAYSQGKPIIEDMPVLKNDFQDMYKKIEKLIKDHSVATGRRVV